MVTVSELMILITAKDSASATIRGVEAEAGTSFGNIAKMAGVAAIGLAAIGTGVAAVAVKMASEFQKNMETIHTQAGASQADVDSMAKSVLAMASSVGTSSDTLADGLYHLVSQGIKPGADAMAVLKVAAEGAKVGNADLVDVTNALGAAIASNISGAQNYTEAMGAMNATVGSGDMRMQDLADAMGTGILASAKVFGLSLTDVNAALATFGDNNIRGSQAGTRLRMALSMLAAPSKAASDALGSIGIGQTELADDMRKPDGLLVALQDLKAHLEASGLSASQQAEVLSKAFGGGKTSSGIMILLDQTARLQSKYEDITKGANGFNDAWTATTHNVSFQFDQLKAGLGALGIKIGTALLPYVSQAMAKLTEFVGWLASPAVSGAIGGVFDSIKNGIASAVDWIANTGIPVFENAFETIRTAVQPAIDVLKPLAENLLSSLRDAFNNLKGPLADVGQSLASATPVWKALGAALVIIAAVSLEGITLAVKTFSAVARPALEGLAPVIDGISAAFKFLEEHKGETLSALAGIGAATTVLAGILLAGIVPALATTTASLIAEAAAATAAWIATMGPIALVVAAVVAAAAGIGIAVYEIVTHWDEIKSATMTAVNTVVNFLQDHWQLIVSILTGPIGAAVVAIVTHWDEIKSAFSDAWNFIQGIGEDIANWFENLPGNIMSALGDLSGTLKSAGSDLINGLWNGAKTLWETVYSWISSIGGKVLTAIGDLGSILYDIGKSIIQGLWDGMKSIWGDVSGWLGGLGSKITSLKGPPATDAVLLVENGKLIMGGLAKGLQQGFDEQVVPVLTGTMTSISAATGADAALAAIAKGLTVNNISGSTLEGTIDANALAAAKSYALAGGTLQNIQGNGTINPFVNPDGSANYAAIYAQPPNVPLSYGGIFSQPGTAVTISSYAAQNRNGGAPAIHIERLEINGVRDAADVERVIRRVLPDEFGRMWQRQAATAGVR